MFILTMNLNVIHVHLKRSTKLVKCIYLIINSKRELKSLHSSRHLRLIQFRNTLFHILNRSLL